MPSDRMIRQNVPVFSEKTLDSLAGHSAPEVKFYTEDGWVFREHPGKGIECVGRSEDVYAADLALKIKEGEERFARH